MGLFGVKRSRRRNGGLRQATPEDNAYLMEWARQRRGVEAYLEPKTNVTEATVVLVAHDGEWTRRRATERDVRALGTRLGVPVYDVKLVGYPQRMRAYTAALAKRQKQTDR
jgi:hypothetical protein